MQKSIMDPLAGSPWSAPGTVAGFVQSPPNDVLQRYARTLVAPGARALDIGCGAARNAVPLAESGWDVTGLDLSWPMLIAAAERAREAGVAARVHLALAPMDALPVPDRAFDLIVAHGIWNLARSAAEFRAAVREAARVAKPGASLFVFTFSRKTLPGDATPMAGEPFAFTQFSGRAQTFLTEEQLIIELGSAGFVLDPAVPLSEYNRPTAVRIASGPPVIYEAAFRLLGQEILRENG
jgi:SAM-dependent methyltransferase